MPQNEDRGHGLLPGSLRAGAMAVSEAEQTWNLWVSHPFRRRKRKGWGTEVYSKNRDASEREPRHGLLPRSPRPGPMAVSEAVQTWNASVSHPFRRKKRKGWGTEVSSKSLQANRKSVFQTHSPVRIGGLPLPIAGPSAVRFLRPPNSRCAPRAVNWDNLAASISPHDIPHAATAAGS